MSSKHLSPGQFPGLPYPRLREAYARATVHEVGEAKSALESTLKETGLPIESLKQMAKSSGVPNSDRSFELVSQNPVDTYNMGHHTAAINTLAYMLNDQPEMKEQAKQELLVGFKRRHAAMKSPHFSAIVN